MPRTDIAVFGGGCFWCTEAVFGELKGVNSVMPGYAGGNIKDPAYEDVCMGKTGHAEVIKVEYDTMQISYNDLLTVFFTTHDPTILNKQGSDVGTQYRSVIFYTNEEQAKEAREFIEKLVTAGTYYKPIVTEIKPFEQFYPAEEYHREYYLHNSDKPYCELVINPKLKKLEERFAKLLKPGI